jgi:Galactosyltransferase
MAASAAAAASSESTATATATSTATTIINTKVHYKLIILVIASRGEYYDKFIKYMWLPIIKYIKLHNLDVLIQFLFNNSPTDDLDIDIQTNILKFGYEECFMNITHKTIDAISICNEKYTYDFIFRTNMSSFLHINNLIKKIEPIPKTEIYSGIIGKLHNNSFCSGAGYLISRDVTEYLLSNKDKINHKIIDDVAVGIVLHKYIKHGPSNYIKERHDIDTYNNNTRNADEIYELMKHDLDNLKKIVSNIYHVRLKNPNRHFDIVFAKFLADTFYSL